MSNFAILRTAKLKTLGNVSASLSHTYRTRETPNADPDKADRNEYSRATPDEVMQALRDRLPEKRRKDAVIGLEYFVGGSPEWFEGKTQEQQDAYLKDAVKWLESRHGKDNVIGWSIHRDEKTPHLVAYVVPLDDNGKLNAKKWTGGASAMSKMQTDFAKTVGACHGMQRGIEGSRAHHQSIKDFYAQIESPSKHVTISPEDAVPKVLRKGVMGIGEARETPEMVATRLTNEVREAYAPAVEAAKLAASERHRAEEMALSALILGRERKEDRERLEALQRHFAPFLELAILDKQACSKLLIQAQEQVKAIKAEKARAEHQAKIDKEKQRRIDDLVRVERKTAGASCTFARIALEALQKAGGDASRVDWLTVEKSTFEESVLRNKQEPKDVLAALLKHSPAMVDPQRLEKVKASLPTVQKEVDAPSHDAPSLG